MSGCKTSIKKVKDVTEATALVHDWFERENRPATPQSLTDALGSRVSKTCIQKILDQLHADSKLCVKDLKKIRFYYLRIDEPTAHRDGEGNAICDAPNVTTATGDEKADASAERDDSAALCDVSLAASSLAEKYCSLARWRGWPSQEERAAQQDALTREVRQLEADVEVLQGGRKADEKGVADAETRASRVRRAVCRYRRARQFWTERKGWAMRLLEATGGDAHSPQHMAALLGCTTDADVGVSFESTAVALPRQMLREIGLN
ncbi:Hop2,probable meiosis-specific protein [Leptomonas pyrrhocoris]|uniref:Hop2,probable meiosis-specific protein n=1 Tax=Leptomonas pyrrhocoris TaxID=157538 RepID=A0A0M9G7L3_LEPPY|nr:Hop2,probable meiosis-specific protein [Leptomonas pyrrhocoris]KPA84193.1 Hop2,probable meiosis-specific protein [Leptomonas pyrrhocoris]|eukprot:XP_015662632.1 Hop2,probable meiosis-specific protein [Leptomonas pyrrhocoris]